MALPVIKEWQYRAVRRRAQGDDTHGCAVFAGVPHAQLQWSLHNDENFRKLYEQAGEGAPKKPQ